MSDKKYKREEKAKDDKQQKRLDPNSPSFMKAKPKVEVNITEIHTGTYSCPFCLHAGKINGYLISTKKGYDKRLGHCPECNNKMMLKTLLADMTPEQFAQFAYGYSCQGYWQKVSFAKFNERLKLIGWQERFWNKYRELKGTLTISSEEEDAYESQKKWAETEAGY
jgi:hypothetical protein